MKYSESKIGRVFILRMEDGDTLNDSLEAFAQEHGIERALAFYVGGVADGSKVVVGPDEAEVNAVLPLVHVLRGAQEAFAVGTLFPNEDGRPVLHMHTASGREGGATVGCTRAGLRTWLVGEVVMVEIVGTGAQRKLDQSSGFELLEV
jgi:predicted DNA-binding protein with PD1-like motif